MAAADVSAPDLRATLLTHARERAGLVVELQSAVWKLGASPENHGSAMGAMRRGLASLREMLHGAADAVVVVAECRRADHAALRAYKSWLRRIPLGEHSHDARALHERKMTRTDLAMTRTARQSRPGRTQKSSS